MPSPLAQRERSGPAQKKEAKHDPTAELLHVDYVGFGSVCLCDLSFNEYLLRPLDKRREIEECQPLRL